MQAPTREHAAVTAARRTGPRGGWRGGPNVTNEVYARDEYPEHALPGNYIRTVIVGDSVHDKDRYGTKPKEVLCTMRGRARVRPRRWLEHGR